MQAESPGQSILAWDEKADCKDHQMVLSSDVQTPKIQWSSTGSQTGFGKQSLLRCPLGITKSIRSLLQQILEADQLHSTTASAVIHKLNDVVRKSNPEQFWIYKSMLKGLGGSLHSFFAVNVPICNECYITYCLDKICFSLKENEKLFQSCSGL